MNIIHADIPIYSYIFQLLLLLAAGCYCWHLAGWLLAGCGQTQKSKIQNFKVSNIAKSKKTIQLAYLDSKPTLKAKFMKAYQKVNRKNIMNYNKQIHTTPKHIYFDFQVSLNADNILFQ